MPALESDTVIRSETPVLPDTAAEPDSTTQSDTTTAQQSIDEFTPLWESDTLYLGEDSIQQYTQAPLVKGDTLLVEPEVEHSASQALMYALALPGLGQVYNKKYWKIPIVWAAIGGGIYAISFNTTQYKQSSEYYVENPDDPNAERYLKFWRRNMELSFIATAAVYALQALDAYVDALLYYWDVNENLSMELGPSLSPVINPSGFVDPALGFTCRLNLKYGGHR